MPYGSTFGLHIRSVLHSAPHSLIQYRIQFYIQCFILQMGYLLLFKNFIYFPEICTLETTILAKKDSCGIPQFSRKIYIVSKIGLAMSVVGFWRGNPWLCGNQWKIMFYSTNLLIRGYHSCQKEFLWVWWEILSARIVSCVQICGLGPMYQSIPSLTIPSLRGFARFHCPGSRVFAHVLPPGYVAISGKSSPIPQSAH